MRLIPPEDLPIEVAMEAPLTLSWNPMGANSGGHPGEYLLGLTCVTGIRGDKDIPEPIATALAEDLGDEWFVSNRGTRIEISHKSLGNNNHALIETAVTRLLHEVVEPRYLTR